MANSPGSGSPLSGLSLVIDAMQKSAPAPGKDPVTRRVLGALTDGFVPVVDLPGRVDLDPEVVVKTVNDLRAKKAIDLRQSNGQYLVGLTSKGYAEAFED
ncbi:MULTISPECIES: hypothetical protein [Rhodospirillales]|uniref:Uncharacterized protein n=2 Tax=Rhodospirillales TaxID=204441 RepID=B6IND2_RHOCS|nr:hypothetical protein [Rhodospirillum centenum]ACI99029.1 hypothetical protein RC1_1627 [Rhodospirillum centenum SW]